MIIILALDWFFLLFHAKRLTRPNGKQLTLPIFRVQFKAKHDSFIEPSIGKALCCDVTHLKHYFFHVNYATFKSVSIIWKRLNRGTRLASQTHTQTHARAQWISIIMAEIQLDDLALMCLRSRCKCPFFVCLFCFGVIWWLWENTTHHSLWLLIVSIVKIDTDNRSTWDSTYRPLCDALLLTLARISSLSFDANANEQTADADKNIGILSIRATQEWSFKTNSRFEQEVEKKSKWKLMDFVAKTCIQIQNHDHEHMQRASKWGNVKCA